MSTDAASQLMQIQANYERMFNCLICLTPKLRMVYGSCQHRICQQCLYSEDGQRRAGMQKCPYCQRAEAFPSQRPDIPEDNINMQKYLGISQCSSRGCNMELWLWELSEHQEQCHGKTTQQNNEEKTCDRKSSKSCEKLLKEKKSLGPVLRSRIERTQRRIDHLRKRETGSVGSYIQYF